MCRGPIKNKKQEKQAEAKTPHSWFLGLAFLPREGHIADAQMDPCCWAHAWAPALLCNVNSEQLRLMGME